MPEGKTKKEKKIASLCLLFYNCKYPLRKHYQHLYILHLLFQECTQNALGIDVKLSNLSQQNELSLAICKGQKTAINNK